MQNLAGSCIMFSMTIRVAVAGASGYAGGEFLRLLLDHPAVVSGEMEIGALTAGSNAGQSVAEHHPHLMPLSGRLFEETTTDVLAGHDVVVLGLPHGYSAELAGQLGDDVLVIDLGADFRLRDPRDWEAYYGGEHAGSWPYGMPELPGQRDQLRGGRRIAVPGCFPTGATLALVPGIAANVLDPESITVVSVTGASGAGKSAKVPMLASEVMGSARAYGVTTHRHTPEIVQNVAPFTERGVSLSFTPVLAPMARGILTTAVLPTSSTAEELRVLYNRAYSEEPFVHVLPTGVQPMTSSVLGSNAVQIGIEVDARSGSAVLTAAVDNLAKGTAGAAIQSMNIALDLPETSGLSSVGVAP